MTFLPHRQAQVPLQQRYQMTENTKEFNVIIAVDTTYINESFWSSITSDYLPFLAKSFAEMGARVSMQFVCLTQSPQRHTPEINASPWLTQKHDDIRHFADSIQGRSCKCDIAEIFRYVAQEGEKKTIHGLVVFAATQKQRSKAKSFENETKAIALRLKQLGLTLFIFDNADEYNLISSNISEQFGKAAMWANGLHVSFHSESLRILYEYMKIIGPVVAGDLVALKGQSGDLITVHGNQLFRKCILKVSSGATR